MVQSNRNQHVVHIPTPKSVRVEEEEEQGGGPVFPDEWFEHCSLDAELTKQLIEQNQHELSEYTSAKQFEPRTLSFFGSEYRPDEKRCEGDIRLTQIFYLLDTIMLHKGWTREEAQIKLHKAYVIAALPLIYGRDWELHAHRVLARFGVTDHKSLVLALFPRRYGKTIAVACFIAVMLVVLPSIVISTFSTGKRASGSMMEEVIRILSGHPEIMARIVKQNEEKLCIAREATQKRFNKDVSTFNSFPSNPKGQYTYTYTYTHTYTHTCISLFR